MDAGDHVRVARADVTSEGVLMSSFTENHLVVKLDGGCNVSIVRGGADMGVFGTDVYDTEDVQSEGNGTSEIELDDDPLTISPISTGGTIALMVGYRTGAVTAQFDAKDVLRTVPDLAGRANHRGRVIANIFSENMTIDVWVDLAEAVTEEIEGGVDGVVVMHGTDTTQFSALAMSFMLGTPVPIVFIGSQHSTDRPFPDDVMNAVCAVEVAKAEAAEVMARMHASEFDDVCAFHEEMRVRKSYTSRRDTFETVGAKSPGEIGYEVEEVTFRRDYTPRCKADLAPHADAESEMELVKFTPGIDPATLDYLDEKAGVVIKGAGLDHVHTDLIPWFEELVEDDTVVAMTSQCLKGRVCDRVYDTDHDLFDAGVIEVGDALLSAAKVRLMWALANIADPTDTIGRNLEGELTQRSVP